MRSQQSAGKIVAASTNEEPEKEEHQGTEPKPELETKQKKDRRALRNGEAAIGSTKNKTTSEPAGKRRADPVNNEAAGKLIMKLQGDVKSKDGHITQLESENAKLESENAKLKSENEVLKNEKTSWEHFMFRYKHTTACATMIEEMPLAMKQSLLERFEVMYSL